MTPHDQIHRLEEVTHKLGTKVSSYRNSAVKRYPHLFILLTTFGFVALLYGFEKVIDTIPFFVEHPWSVLIAGLVVLLATGSLYKKLS